MLYGGDNMKRLNVNVSDELMEQIDKCAKKTGINRSAWCQMSLAQAVQMSDLTKNIRELTEVLNDLRKG